MELFNGNEDLNQFIVESKRRGLSKLLNPSSMDKFSLIVGNEAMDLDSFVSSIVYAYFLSKKEREEIVLPLIQIPKEDFSLRTDVAWLFNEVRLDWENLIFIEDFEGFLNENSLKSLDSNRLRVVLTDHNVLSRKLCILSPFVEEIIDHHADESKYPDVKGEKRTIETVGSASTLVAQKIRQEENLLEGNAIPSLLLGTILLDTVNLMPEFNRATPKDVEVASYLLKGLEERNGGDIKKFQNDFFDRLQKERFDQHNLSTKDLLRVDYKQFTMDTKETSKKYEVGISSSKIKVQDWLSKDPEIINFFKDFSQANHLSVLYAMTTYIDGEETKRELLIYSDTHKEIAHRSARYLEENTDLELKEVDIQEWKEKNGIKVEDGVYFQVYHQGNSKASRKQVQPFVSKFFASQSL